MTVRPINPKTDIDEWARMRELLWPDCPPEVTRLEMDQQLNEEIGAVFVIDRGDGKLGGFAEVLIKSWAESCHSGKVAYLEGWWVDEDLRKQKWGIKLLSSVESWARARRCREMASDTWPQNTVSRSAHARFGFKEVETLVHFKKEL